MAVETRKILDPDIQVLATASACPPSSAMPRRSMSSSRTRSTPDEARELLREAPGVQVVDRREDGGYVTQTEAAGEDGVYVPASAATRRCRTASPSGASPTTSARARR